MGLIQRAKLHGEKLHGKKLRLRDKLKEHEIRADDD
jgi:hypothetical protein